MNETPEIRGTFLAKVLPNASLMPLDQPRWIGWLMRHVGKTITVEFSREKRIRSLAQNSRYWTMIVPCFSEWSGYSTEEAHEVLLQMFSKSEGMLPSGEIITRITRSKDMTVEQFNEFTLKVERFLAEHGFVFPGDAA